MPPPINLMRGWPASSLLPTYQIKQAAAECLSNPQIAEAGLSYGPDPGYEPAREEIAKWLTKAYARNTPTLAKNICITGGASQNLGNVLSVYTDPAYTRNIWIVAPAYFLAFRVFEDAGFAGRLKAIPEGEEGLDIVTLEVGMVESDREWELKNAGTSVRYKNAGERTHAKVYKHVVYCVPTFANPSSATMSLRTRHQLVLLARQFDALVIADDVYDFLHWPAEPSDAAQHRILPRLVDIDREINGGTQRPGVDGFGNACSNGSFSKIAGPGVRCGWLEGSEKFAYGVSQTGTTRSGGAPSQMTSTFMTWLLQTGHLQAHIARTLQPAYASRYRLLLKAINTQLLPLGFTLPKPTRNDGIAGGFFLWLGLPEGFAAADFARVCAEGVRGVIVAPGAMFEVPGDSSVQFDGNIRLCFAWESEANLVEGVKRMRGAAERLLVEKGEGEYVFIDKRDAMRGVTDWRGTSTDSRTDATSSPEDSTGSQTHSTRSRENGYVLTKDISDNVRIKWERRPRNSIDGLYKSTVRGKWWSNIPARVDDRGHIGRIMETTLGEQLTGDNRCAHCVANDFECWRYSKEGLDQVFEPVSDCARCMSNPTGGGCSVATRTPVRNSKSARTATAGGFW